MTGGRSSLGRFHGDKVSTRNPYRSCSMRRSSGGSTPTTKSERWGARPCCVVPRPSIFAGAGRERRPRRIDEPMRRAGIQARSCEAGRTRVYGPRNSAWRDLVVRVQHTRQTPAGAHHRSTERDWIAPHVMVAPVTSTIHGAPSEVIVGVSEGLKHDSAVKLDHVQTVERARLTRRMGHLSLGEDARGLSRSRDRRRVRGLNRQASLNVCRPLPLQLLSQFRLPRALGPRQRPPPGRPQAPELHLQGSSRPARTSRLSRGTLR